MKMIEDNKGKKKGKMPEGLAKYLANKKGGKGALESPKKGK